MSFCATGFEHKTIRARNHELFYEINFLLPWAELISSIIPHAPVFGTKGGQAVCRGGDAVNSLLAAVFQPV